MIPNDHEFFMAIVQDPKERVPDQSGGEIPVIRIYATKANFQARNEKFLKIPIRMEYCTTSNAVHVREEMYWAFDNPGTFFEHLLSMFHLAFVGKLKYEKTLDAWRLTQTLSDWIQPSSRPKSMKTSINAIRVAFEKLVDIALSMRKGGILP